MKPVGKPISNERAVFLYVFFVCQLKLRSCHLLKALLQQMREINPP